ncbi:hypothetical protein HPP92_013393 [Vanilla planifolia]|uniref:Uncharacterized protein n=1 Tax=Vanilla planifolia TaxID=51239 RepID=A0A835QXM1_VANPL|nr:hypothetical protein HPP92_013393 [Vanilla planifolia]
MVSASHDDCSIFPPKLHEGLHLRPHADQTLASPASAIRDPGESAMIGPCFHVRENGEKELGPNRRPLSALAKRMVGYWVELLRFNFVIRCGGSVESVLGILSFATMACVAGVFFYMRRRHRRDKEFLLFLIQEKNQVVSRRYPIWDSDLSPTLPSSSLLFSFVSNPIAVVPLISSPSFMSIS